MKNAGHSQGRQVRFALKEMIAKHERLTGKKITYKDISAQTGLSVTSISNIANNHKKNVGLETLRLLCFLFSCSPGDLLIFE